MTVPEARRDPRLRRYPLRRLRLPVAAGTLSLVVPDAAWLRSDAGARSAVAGEEPPYWAEVWPAAVAVARWLCRRRGDVAGRTVLDLGCGSGAVAAAAALCGAAVTCADRDPAALAFASFNAAHQGAAPGRCRTVQLDWRRATLAGRFDLVCLCDVTYRPVHHGPVLRHVRACLAEHGLCVHADPLRRESDGFLVSARAAFAVRECTVATHFAGRRLPVRLAFLARSAAALSHWIGTQGSGLAEPAGAAAAAAR